MVPLDFYPGSILISTLMLKDIFFPFLQCHQHFLKVFCSPLSMSCLLNCWSMVKLLHWGLGSVKVLKYFICFMESLATCIGDFSAVLRLHLPFCLLIYLCVLHVCVLHVCMCACAWGCLLL